MSRTSASGRPHLEHKIDEYDSDCKQLQNQTDQYDDSEGGAGGLVVGPDDKIAKERRNSLQVIVGTETSEDLKQQNAIRQATKAHENLIHTLTKPLKIPFKRS